MHAILRQSKKKTQLTRTHAYTNTVTWTIIIDIYGTFEAEAITMWWRERVSEGGKVDNLEN